ncbi:MAG: hypothetical protein JW850_17320 [Thermoflexales bacterium]|nr:hypothetical protein [Thermoflexales bacterium]
MSLQTHAGEPVAVGSVVVTPYSQALTVRWPGGAFVWNRPLALVVEHDGWVERVPILDLTRLMQLSLLGLSLVTALMAIYKHLQAVTSNQ